MAELDERRRAQVESLLAEMFETLDEKEGVNVTTLSTDSRQPDYDAEWDASDDGWSGHSKPIRSDDEGIFLRRYTWRYAGQRETGELEVPGPLFKYYTERLRTTNYGTYISDPFDEQFISSLAERIRAFGDDTG